jgi:hypothetical protein
MATLKQVLLLLTIIAVFNIGFCTFFWGAFEQAYQNPNNQSPVWSTVFVGYPHHYIVGAVLTYAGYMLTVLFLFLTLYKYNHKH